MGPDLPPAPLILTLEMDTASSEFFERCRREYFPPELNRVPAHLSLFHKLPGEETQNVLEAVEEACRKRPPMKIRIAGTRNLGRGVAFRVQSAALARFRAELAHAYASWLTPQDRQPFNPHITIQNKVTPEEARRVFSLLTGGGWPQSLTGVGAAVWRYLGGPWERLHVYSFRDAEEPILNQDTQSP